MFKLATTFLLLSTLDAGATTAHSPSAERVLSEAARAMGRFERGKATEMSGSIAAEGRTGAYRELVRMRDGAYVTRAQYKLFGGGEGLDGRIRWKQDPSAATHQLNAPFTKADTVTLAWMKRRGYLIPGTARIQRSEREVIGGRPATVLTMQPSGGNAIRLAFDDATHLLVRSERIRPLDTIIEKYSDYRPVGKAKVPFTIDIEESGDQQLIHVSRYRQIARGIGAMLARPPAPRDLVISGPATIPLNSADYAVIPATINGHQYNFVVDTGGHDILLPPIAADLGLGTEGQGTSGGGGPGRVTTTDTQVAELKFGSATMTNQHFAVLDLGTGFQTKGRPPRAGILGLEIFERMAVTIDEPHGRLTIEPFEAGRRCEGDAIPLLFDDDQPAVQGTIDGIPAQIGIDVGNGGMPIVLWRWAEAHKVADRFSNGEKATGSGVGGTTTNYRTPHHEIMVGQTPLHDMTVYYTKVPTGYFSSRADSMNIGRALLQKYVVRFDYSQQQMCVMRP